MSLYLLCPVRATLLVNGAVYVMLALDALVIDPVAPVNPDDPVNPVLPLSPVAPVGPVAPVPLPLLVIPVSKLPLPTK